MKVEEGELSREEQVEIENDSEDSETGEDDSEAKDESGEEELVERSNLEVAWEALEVARLGFTKLDDSEALWAVNADADKKM